MPAKNHSIRIALLLERQIGHCRSVLSGIQRFALQHPRWIFHEGPPDIRILPRLREWKPQGIIGHIYTEGMHSALTRLGLPMVLTTRTLPGIKTPDVDVDHRAVGRMAADYFLQKGFCSFAYLGSAHARFSLEREAGYRNQLKAQGYSIASCHADYLPLPPLNTSWKRLDRAVARWLQQCPKPLALFTSNDIPARLISEECRRLGLSVPQTVSILGVDNDEYECGLAAPPLSSIAIPSEEIGYRSALLLERLMRGRPIKNPHWILPPLHIVTRASTDHHEVKDPVVQKALLFIKQHVLEPICIEDVRKHCAVSRRILERRMQSVLKISTLKVIHDAKIERAKPLLTQTRLDLETIAIKSGFSSARQLADVFRARTGQNPTAFKIEKRQIARGHL